MMKNTLFLLALLLLANPCKSDVTLPSIFTSNMVLQRDMPLTIWGWADKNEKITIQFNEQIQSTRAGKDGTWSIQFNPISAVSQPISMEIKGKNKIILDNLLVGDVWICSGQSNMYWPMKRLNVGLSEAKAADYPNLRMFTVTNEMALSKQDNLNGSGWMLSTGQDINNFSAVAYYFGKYLHTETGIPIGLISTSWGGTNVEAWTSMETLRKYGHIASVYENLNKTVDYSVNASEEQKKKRTPVNQAPSSLFNQMIHPFLNLSISGAIWYQGESNANRALEYASLFPDMIQDWRMHWDQGDFPFLFVQLAAYDRPETQTWPELREAQRKTLEIPNTGMAVTIDIGHPTNIHPQNKWDVGKRLALHALHLTYNKEITYSGPVLEKVDVDDGRILVSFDQVGSGLKVRGDLGYLIGFEISSDNKEFEFGMARIVNNRTVEVWSEKVKKPQFVRYAWQNYPADANLTNSENLPASPFRTGTWEWITEGNLYGK